MDPSRDPAALARIRARNAARREREAAAPQHPADPSLSPAERLAAERALKAARAEARAAASAQSFERDRATLAAAFTVTGDPDDVLPASALAAAFPHLRPHPAVIRAWLLLPPSVTRDRIRIDGTLTRVARGIRTRNQEAP